MPQSKPDDLSFLDELAGDGLSAVDELAGPAAPQPKPQPKGGFIRGAFDEAYNTLAPVDAEGNFSFDKLVTDVASMHPFVGGLRLLMNAQPIAEHLYETSGKAFSGDQYAQGQLTADAVMAALGYKGTKKFKNAYGLSGKGMFKGRPAPPTTMADLDVPAVMKQVGPPPVPTVKLPQTNIQANWEGATPAHVSPSPSQLSMTLPTPRTAAQTISVNVPDEVMSRINAKAEKAAKAADVPSAPLPATPKGTAPTKPAITWDDIVDPAELPEPPAPKPAAPAPMVIDPKLEALGVKLGTVKPRAESIPGQLEALKTALAKDPKLLASTVKRVEEALAKGDDAGAQQVLMLAKSYADETVRPQAAVPPQPTPATARSKGKAKSAPPEAKPALERAAEIDTQVKAPAASPEVDALRKRTMDVVKRAADNPVAKRAGVGTKLVKLLTDQDYEGLVAALNNAETILK